MNTTTTKSTIGFKYSILMRSELFGTESIGFDRRLEDVVRTARRIEKNHMRDNPADNCTFTIITHYDK